MSPSRKRRAVLSGIVCVLLCADPAPLRAQPPGHDVTPDATTAPIAGDPFGQDAQRVVRLSQNWTPDLAGEWYTTPQGSQIVPYEWLLALETPNGSLFRDPKTLLKYRFILRKPDPRNPDGLPVGFTRHDGADDRSWFGFTCAACHTNTLHYQGTAYVIDGGPSLADVGGFLQDLTRSLEKVRDDPAAFDRFHTRVKALSTRYADADKLRRMVRVVADARKGYDLRNFTAEHPGGYGRVDAFGAILNEVFHHAVAAPHSSTDNTKAADAPVSYPFLWDAPFSDVVQWPGLTPNGGPLGVNSLGRNVGEVLGVFGDYDLTKDVGLVATSYRSSVAVQNLRRLEEILGSLWSPRWPSTFPPPQPALLAEGATLFRSHCLECHPAIRRDDPNRNFKAFVGDAKTDGRMLSNFLGRRGSSGVLAGRKSVPTDPLSPPLGSTIAGDAILKHAVVGVILGSWKDAPADSLSQIEFGRGRFFLAFAGPIPARYKARPLNGIWATAPYLHNGSVPTLADLLKPADQRPRVFHVGSREFDPAKVGFTDDPRFFEFRARDATGKPIPGNSNEGHEYGKDLTDRQRAALLEYLKTL